MGISYSAVWDDAVRMLRAHASEILGVAGVFIFLPILLTSYFLPMPQGEPQQMAQAFADHIQANFHWFLLARLVSMFGSASILLLLFNSGVTVGGALNRALALFPFYVLASFIALAVTALCALLFLVPGVALVVGLARNRALLEVVALVLLLPAIYLLGRLAPVSAVVVAELRRNPIDALRRSLGLTRGTGWRVIGLLALVLLAGLVCIAAVTAVFGSLFLLVAEAGVGRLLVVIVSALANSVMEVVLVLVIAALYRHLAERGSGRRPFD